MCVNSSAFPYCGGQRDENLFTPLITAADRNELLVICARLHAGLDRFQCDAECTPWCLTSVGLWDDAAVSSGRKHQKGLRSEVWVHHSHRGTMGFLLVETKLEPRRGRRFSPHRRQGGGVNQGYATGVLLFYFLRKKVFLCEQRSTCCKILTRISEIDWGHDSFISPASPTPPPLITHSVHP